MTTIEITFENSTFNVDLKVNTEHSEQIGYKIETLQEAMRLAEIYKRMDSSISIVISSDAKENMNPYKEMGKIAESIGLPKNSFNGLVNTLIDYRDSVKSEYRSLNDVLNMFEPNKTIN